MARHKAALRNVAGLIERFCQDERCDTLIPGMTLLRSDNLIASVPAVYEPMLCLIAQGRKRTLLGDQVFDYGGGDYLIASVDLPIISEIVEASPQFPYLAFSLRLDLTILAELLFAMPDQPTPNRPTTGLTVNQLTPELLDALFRLLCLLEQPRDIAILAPLIEREILYHLLKGEQGQTLRQLALAGSHLGQISKAVSWIRDHYTDPLRIDTAAQIANMSPSSFHRHFKAVTAMSPLQYQKQIRLQEARRLLLSQHADAASVGFTVGYQSPSQFSREYARLFGIPPIRDANRFRDAALLRA